MFEQLRKAGQHVAIALLGTSPLTGGLAAMTYKDWDNLRDPVKSGDVVRVSTEPKETVTFATIGAGKGGFVAPDRRPVVAFTDERGRKIEVPVPQADGLKIGDSVIIEKKRNKAAASGEALHIRVIHSEQ